MTQLPPHGRKPEAVGDFLRIHLRNITELASKLRQKGIARIVSVQNHTYWKASSVNPIPPHNIRNRPARHATRLFIPPPSYFPAHTPFGCNHYQPDHPLTK